MGWFIFAVLDDYYRLSGRQRRSCFGWMMCAAVLAILLIGILMALKSGRN